ncbi:hypothetical protein LINPERHAP2_LOCUS12773 [Linum perenne]
MAPRPDGVDLAAPKFQVYWDLSRVKFRSGPEPQSGFYIAVVADREIVLLVGDLAQEVWGKTKARRRSGQRRKGDGCDDDTDNNTSNNSIAKQALFMFRFEAEEEDDAEGYDDSDATPTTGVWKPEEQQ